MIKTYKYKVYASKHTKELSRLVTSSGFLWNHVVRLSKRYYKLYHKSLSPTRLQSHMAKLAKRSPYWAKLYSQSVQEVCQRYYKALNEHFKQKHRGFPRVHSPHREGSFVFKGKMGYSLYTEGKHGILIINKLNKQWTFKFKLTRPWGEDIKNVIVRRDCDNCLYVCVVCDVPDMHLERAESGAIGVDFGMKTFLTASDGRKYSIPDYHKEALSDMKEADRRYSLKRNAKVYGTSFKRARKARQKAHRAVADKRSDFHWKLAHELCKRNRFIALETLNIKGMQRHKRWGRKVSSLGFSEFVEKLKYVAAKYGTEVVEIDRWYASSQTCSECGYKYEGTKDLKVREWDCPCCGAHHDRDVNAAVNILERGVKEYGEGVPRGGSGNKTTVGKSDCRSRDSVERPRHRLRIPRL